MVRWEDPWVLSTTEIIDHVLIINSERGLGTQVVPDQEDYGR